MRAIGRHRKLSGRLGSARTRIGAYTEGNVQVGCILSGTSSSWTALDHKGRSRRRCHRISSSIGSIALALRSSARRMRLPRATRSSDEEKSAKINRQLESVNARARLQLCTDIIQIRPKVQIFLRGLFAADLSDQLSLRESCFHALSKAAFH